MLGRLLIDREGVDTGISLTQEEGLGLIPAVTSFLKEKITVRTEGKLHPATGINIPVSGYEIHLGETVIPAEEKPNFLLLNNGQEEGYYGKNGRVIGTYLHHLFHNDEWRNEWLNSLRKAKGMPLREIVHISALKDQKYDELAAQMLAHLDWEKLKEITFNWGTKDEMV
jgi:adenosylcobyric acid synthase